MICYLNVDKDKYLLSIASVGGGIEADIDLAEYDFSDGRLRAYKWKKSKLVFDADRYAIIKAEQEAEQEADKPTAGGSVYDELATAYRQGVQEA